MTWGSFIAQFEAQGRDKADGYSPAHFEGMDATEMARARAMMEERAAAGDTTDVGGLRFVGNAGSVAVLETAQPRDRILGIAFEAARRETLFSLTRDPGYLEPLVDRLDSRDERDAAFAAQALARHPLPPHLTEPLASRIVGGRHEGALLWIVGAWLSARGASIWEVPVFVANLPFIRRIMGARPAKRPVFLEMWRPSGS